MSQHYSDPTREEDPYALPNVEVFYMDAEDFSDADADSWMAERLTAEEYSPTACKDLEGWYYWLCFPGCLPDSEPYGPYATEEDALAAAQEDNA